MNDITEVPVAETTIVPRPTAAGYDVGAYRFADDPLCDADHQAGRSDASYWEANMDLVYVTHALGRAADSRGFFVSANGVSVVMRCMVAVEVTRS